MSSRGKLFQSTHPRGVRLLSNVLGYAADVFQSTHPRGVRLVNLVTGAGDGMVSIHAPAWGATFGNNAEDAVRKWFQSTHPRGVRLVITLPPPARGPSFNPRTRVGCDLLRRGLIGLIRVSIHAPAWGATGRIHTIGAASDVSIHAPAWGATPTLQLSIRQIMFQSTHPRGVRPHLGRFDIWQLLMFQSTHPRGVRPLAAFITPPSLVGFQSTHPRGVRRGKQDKRLEKVEVSIHAPAWGATSSTARRASR